MPWLEYRKIPAMNPSTLVRGIVECSAEEMSISMRHILYAWNHPEKDTPSMIWGRAVHTALLERDIFEERYAIWEFGDRRGNAWKDFAADAQLRGQEVLKQDELDSVIDAALQAATDPLVRAIIKAGQSEVTAMEVEAGMQCRGRIDWISTSEHLLADVKTTASLGPRSFGRDFYKYHYDVKLALYQRWLQRLTGEEWPVVVIVIENDYPHDVWVSEPVPTAVLDQGRERADRLFGQLARALETDEWPGVAHGQPQPLITPFWQMEPEEGTVEWRNE
jgi:hypothetical protein